MLYQKIAVGLISIVLISGCASAGSSTSSSTGSSYGRYHHDRDYYSESSSNYFTVKAKVIKVEPVYESITVNDPETRCWKEKVHHRGHQSSTPVIAGAILGGVVGNQFGGGSGKLSLIHISEPTRRACRSRMPSSA